MKPNVILIMVMIYFSGCDKPTSADEKIIEVPSVSILSPTNSNIIGDSVNIEISASDNKGITKVELYIDNTLASGGELFAPPYAFVWQLGSVKDSSAHTIYAKAYDGDNNVTSSAVRTVYVFRFAPSNLSVAFKGDSAVQLFWMDNSRKESGFEVEQKVNSGNFTSIQTVKANISELMIPAVLTSGNTYTFRIRAVNGTEKSVYSNEVSTVFHFAAPKIISLSSVTSDSVRIQWADSNLYERSHEIYYGKDSSSMMLVKSVPANTTAATIGGIISTAAKHYFMVKAVSLHNSSISSVISISTVDLGMIYVQGGTFQMGSTNAVDNAAAPVHTVTLNSYYMKRTEVTQLEWRTVVNWKKLNGGTTLDPDPSLTKGDNYPVDRVNWNEAHLWITYLNEKENDTRYRLPSEAEWEFAARGGTASKGFIYSGSNDIDNVAWHYGNSTLVTHPVGMKSPNELGIFDMSGNVWELCSDWFAAYTSESQINPTGPNSGSSKVFRGGGSTHDTGSRVAFRTSASPGDSPSYTWGFRYVKMN